jgi:hypothetical protein
MAIEQLSEALKNLIKKYQNSNLLIAKVSSVNKDNSTFNAVLLEDETAELLDVRLKPNVGEVSGFLIYPAVHSLVTVLRSDNKECFLLQCEKIEAILLKNEADFSLEISASGDLIFNGGELGGLVKAKTLQAELQKNNDILASFLTVLNGVPILEAGNGAASNLQIALKSALSGKNIGNFNGIENEKIKQ